MVKVTPSYGSSFSSYDESSDDEEGSSDTEIEPQLNELIEKDTLSNEPFDEYILGLTDNITAPVEECSEAPIEEECSEAPIEEEGLEAPIVEECSETPIEELHYQKTFDEETSKPVFECKLCSHKSTLGGIKNHLNRTHKITANKPKDVCRKCRNRVHDSEAVGTCVLCQGKEHYRLSLIHI